MRIAALLLALFTIVVGMVGIVSPDSDDASPIVLRDAWPTLRGRRCSRSHGARADPGCLELVRPGPCARWEP